MFAKKDFAYFQGITQHASIREAVHTTTEPGGGFVYRGFGFIAAPSVAVHSRTIQDFWLKSAQGERHFTISGGNLPLREGHPITVVWLKDHLVGYANHSSHQYLLRDEGLNAVAGRKPNTSRPAGILLLIAFGLLFVSWTGVDMVSNSNATRNTWAMIVCLTLVAIILIPVLACFVALYRRLRYAERRRAFTKIIEGELKSTLSKTPDLR